LDGWLEAVGQLQDLAEWLRSVGIAVALHHCVQLMLDVLSLSTLNNIWEPRRRQDRDAKGVKGEGYGEGYTPSPAD